jgi:tryptophan halogenase
MDSTDNRTITIIGGGTAGWMTAAALARFLERGWSITLVESDAIGTVGVGEATIPQIHHFNRMLGLDEAAFVRETMGSFKLGIAFEGWRAPGHRYMHAFGQVGRDLGLLPFYQYWLRARATGLEAGEDTLDAFSIAAQAGYAGRFALPDPAKPAAAGGHAYAFHFDAGLYAAYLRRYAEARGVTRVEGIVASVDRDKESGDVTDVTLSDGRTVAGDLFIDCSGFRGLLIEEALGAGYESWQHWLPCDRALAVPCTHGGPPVPYTRAIARVAGWQWQIPLQHRVGNGYVFSSAHISDDDAAAALLSNLPGAPLTEPRPLHFTAGRRKSVWAHNVIAIGLSSGFLEPLESTSIHLIQSGIERLLLRLPSPEPSQSDRDAFNADAALEIERIRDFIILHYFANGRDEPFWAERRATTPPDSLAARIDLFRSSGRIDKGERDLFTELAWQQVLIGQGIMPASWHPLANQLNDSDLSSFLKTARRAVAGYVAAMPLHADFIAAHVAGTEERQMAS